MVRERDRVAELRQVQLHAWKHKVMDSHPPPLKRTVLGEAGSKQDPSQGRAASTSFADPAQSRGPAQAYWEEGSRLPSE